MSEANNYFNTGVEDYSATQLKKGFNKLKKDLVKNLPGIIVWVILVLVVLATVAEFEFRKVFSLDFAAQSLVYALCTYLTFFLKKHIGMNRGRQEMGYLEAKRIHEEKVKEVLALFSDGVSLASFCAYWVMQEFNRARKTILSGSGVTDDEWQKFAPLGSLVHKVSYRTKRLKKQLKKEKINQQEYDLLLELKAMKGEKKLAITCACLVRKQRLTPSDIVYESANREARERTPISLKTVERKQDIIQLASTTAMMFGVMVILPVPTVTEITLQTIIFGLLRVVSLLWTAFYADMIGETLFTVDAVENFKVQDGFLDQAMKWREKHVRENTGTGSELEHAVPSDADGVRQVPCGGAPDGAAEEDPGSCHDGLSE